MIRTKKDISTSLETIFETHTNQHSKDWLLLLELYELADENSSLKERISKRLHTIQTARPEIAQLIIDGVDLVTSSYSENL